MNASIDISFVIPVFNRPNEIEELLATFLELNTDKPFEIVIIEDGSQLSSEQIIDNFKEQLNINYHKKSNTGPGDSRNFGMSIANGNYYIILDSDVLLPENYLTVVYEELHLEYVDCFGGPDDAHSSFSILQKAINFVMTSFVTTGGIRGGKKQIENYQPRSFNMGISKQAFEASGGFGDIHPGEDPDLSLRLKDLGFKTRLFKDAKVFHKRRLSWRKFYMQVHKFGMVRPILNLWHPKSSSITFWFPTLFAFGFVISIVLFFLGFKLPIYLYVLYYALVFLVSIVRTKNIIVALYSLVALTVQFFGYGYGFLKSTIAVNLLNKNPREYFPDLFFSKK